MEEHIQNILINRICDPPALLRQVDTNSAEFLELRDTIRANGLLNSICVRPHPSKSGYYQVIDGMYRLTICRDLDWETIPCVVKDVTNEVLVVLQLIANAVRPETTVTDYARQLKKLQNIFPEITVPELAVMIGRSAPWIYAQLSLLNVHQDTQVLIDRGDIPLSNAYMLAKIPLSLQKNYYDQAMVLPNREFKLLVADVIRQYMETARSGILELHFGGEPDVTPHAYLRSLKVVKVEYEHMTTAAVMLHTEKCRTPWDGWKAALKWAMNLDDRAVAKRLRREVAKHKSLELRRMNDI